MAEITYQMILSTLQTVGLLVGIYYYVMTLSYTRRTQQLTLENRRAQPWMQMMDTTWSKETREAFDVLLSFGHLSDEEFLRNFVTIGNSKVHSLVGGTLWNVEEYY